MARGFDVSDQRAVNVAASVAESTCSVDVLVNGAGISSHRRPAIDIADEDWSRMLAVNLSGPWNTCRALGRGMLARRRGSVINIASTNTIDPSPGIAHYCVSKAGLGMLTKCLALEWASAGVRVNAVGPGRARSKPRLAGRPPPQRRCKAGANRSCAPP